MVEDSASAADAVTSGGAAEIYVFAVRRKVVTGQSGERQSSR